MGQASGRADQPRILKLTGVITLFFFFVLFPILWDMSDVADEIVYLKALLEESRATVKALRLEVAELKAILLLQGISVTPVADDHSGIHSPLPQVS